MRRADRLYRVVELLRRRRRAVTAAQLAEHLEISERTVYRDIRDLISSGVPIQGEAGVGYVLDRSFDLPPVMFREDEVEALVLGARVVQGWGDDALGEAAKQALEKLRAIAPPHLTSRFGDHRLSAFNVDASRTEREKLGRLRLAVRAQTKVRFLYQRADGLRSERVGWPLGIAFIAPLWLVVMYCELREDFRNFRIDRIDALEVLDETFPDQAGRRLEDFLRKMGVDASRDL